MQTYNIHQVLNDFETVFKRKRKGIRLHSISDGHLYLEVVYETGHAMQEIHPDWNRNDIFTRKPGDIVTLSIMLKLWLHKDPQSQPKHRLTLWKSNIYTNPYIAPEYAFAEEFRDAMKAWTKTNTEHVLGQYEIRLDGKILTEARKRIWKTMNRHMNELTDKANPTDENELDLLYLASEQMKCAIDMMQYLFMGPYGSGNEKIDKDTKPEFFPDFNIYQKDIA